MVTEFQKKIVESSSHERLKSDFYAMLMNEEAYKEQIKNLEEENKNLKEKLSEITMVADDEKQSIEHILELEKENEELKKQNDRLTTQIAKQLLKNV